MINKVILIGNIGQDPEVRHLESGVAVASFSLATNENYRDKSGEWQKLTEWHNITAWRGLAENVERNYKKGMQIYVEGKLSTRKWQDKDGNDRYTTDVVANTMRILEKRDANSQSSITGSTTPATPSTTAPGKEHTENIKDTMADDDLPF